MATINIYLTFNGNCETAFEFYRSVFGNAFLIFSRFGEMPPQEGIITPEEDAHKIMHVSLPVGKGTVLMGSDTSGEWVQGFKQGNNFSISVDTDSTEEADRIFSALSVNGMITMPMAKTFWGAYFGMLTDQFGINWMFNLEKPKP